MFNFYRFFSILFIPIVYLNIFLRLINNKEDKKRYKERFGLTNKNKPEKNIIWIHAASVGEFKSSRMIIDSYYKNYSILVTTTTKSAAEYANNFYSDKIIHQYAPFDVEIWIKRFLNFWQPKLVIWIESDFWPIILNAIKQNNIKCILINARISPTSFKRWKLFRKNYNNILSTFDRIFVQSKEDLKRFKYLSDKKIEFIGNLKLAKGSIENLKPKKNNDEKIIMFTSTHKEEEGILLEIIEKIYIKYNFTKFYIAPRHPERSDFIKQNLKKIIPGLNFENNGSHKNLRITIIDSFGKLPKYFNLSDIVFLGGSFSNNGGHNPIEAANYDCAIVSGNRVFNWHNIYTEMESENACFLINKKNELETLIEKLINNENMLKKSKQNAKKFAEKKFFDEEKIKNIINSNLI